MVEKNNVIDEEITNEVDFETLDATATLEIYEFTK